MIRTSATTNLLGNTQQQSKQADSVVLEEEFDPNYEPSSTEINEYAEFLEMDLVNDSDLLWIAREGLKAPLPAAWKPCKTDTDEVYYFNFETGESVWEHPCDEYYKQLYITEKQKKQQRTANSKSNSLNKQNSGILINKTNLNANNNIGGNKLSAVLLGGSLNKFKPLGGINEITPKAGYDVDQYNDNIQHETNTKLLSSTNASQYNKSSDKHTLSSIVSTTNLFNQPLLSSTNKQLQPHDNSSSLDLSTDNNAIQLDSPASKQSGTDIRKSIDSPATTTAATTTVHKTKVTVIPSHNKAVTTHNTNNDAVQQATTEADAEKLNKLKQIEIEKLAYIKQLETDYELFKQCKEAEFDQQKESIQQQHSAELSVMNKTHSSKLFDKQTQLDHDIAAIEKLSIEQRHQKATLQQQVQELNSIVSDNERKLNKLKAEHTHAEQKLVDEFDAIKLRHDANKQTFDQQLTTLQQSIDSKQTELDQLNTDVEKHAQAVAELRAKYTTELDEIRSTHSKQVTQLHQHNANEIDTLNAQHATELQSINSQHSTLINDTGNTAQQNKHLNEQLTELQHKFNDVQLVRNTAEQHLRDIRLQHESEVDVLNERIQSLQSQQPGDTSHEFNQVQTQLTDVTVELKQKKNELHSHSQTISQLTAELHKQSAATSNNDNAVIVQLKRQIDTLNKQLHDAQRKSTNVHNDITMNEQHAQLIEQLGDLQMTLSTQTEQYQATQNLMQKSIDKLQLQLEQAHTELQQLRTNPFKLTQINGRSNEKTEQEEKAMQDDEMLLHEIDDLDDAAALNNKSTRRNKQSTRAHSTTRINDNSQRIAWQSNNKNNTSGDNDLNGSDTDDAMVHHRAARKQSLCMSSDVDTASTKDLSELQFLSERKEKQRHRSQSHKSRKTEYSTIHNNQHTHHIYTAWNNKISTEHHVLSQVRDYVSSEKQHIKQIMKQLNELQVQWKSDKRKYNDKYGHVSTGESTEKQKKFVKLKQTKKQLDDRAKLLNNDIRQLRSVQQWLDKQEYKLVQFTSQLNRVARNNPMDDTDTSIEYEVNHEIESYWNEYIGDVHEYSSYINSTPQINKTHTTQHQRFNTLQPPAIHDRFNNNILSNTHSRVQSATMLPQSTLPLGNTVVAPSNTTYNVDQPMSVNDRNDVQQRVNVLQNMLNRWQNTTNDAASKQTLDTHAQWLSQFNEKVKSIPVTPINQQTLSTINNNSNTQAITIPKSHPADKEIVIRILRE